MAIIQNFSNMVYTQSKVRYERDETVDQKDLNKIKSGMEIQKAYFHFDDKNNKIANVLVRIGNKIAHFFGAKTISQNNLSNCLRKANAYFTYENKDKYKFTVAQLLEAKLTLLEIKSSEKFGGYLESDKGINDKERFNTLSKNLDLELKKHLNDEQFILANILIQKDIASLSCDEIDRFKKVIFPDLPQSLQVKLEDISKIYTNPELLTRMDNKIDKTYGLQSTNRCKNFSACVRDNWNAFDGLILKSSEDPKDWLNNIQYKQLNDAKTKYGEDSDMYINLKNLFNPNKLNKLLPDLSDTLAGHYLSQVKKLMEYLKLPENTPIIVDGLLNPEVGRAIMRFQEQ